MDWRVGPVAIPRHFFAEKPFEFSNVTAVTICGPAVDTIGISKLWAPRGDNSPTDDGQATP
jgi:hypothetical protein